MSKIAIFYGPEGGSVNKVAELIQNKIGKDKAELVAVKGASADDIEKYDKLIFGLSTVGKDTWDSEYSTNDWGKFMPEIGKVDYSNKKVAVFGLGDHVTYAHAFVDHLGLLGKELMANGAALVGPVDPEGYEFEESEAIVDGKFIGLPIDEDFEPEMTDQRVTAWLGVLKPDFEF